jgi:hypothetical protein
MGERGLKQPCLLTLDPRSLLTVVHLRCIRFRGVAATVPSGSIDYSMTRDRHCRALRILNKSAIVAFLFLDKT